MEYQKIINLLENKPNQCFKFRTKAWVERIGERITKLEGITKIVKLNLKLQC